MKKSIRKMLGIVLLLSIPFYFFSCGDDEDKGPDILLPRTDGMYVFGTNTIAEEPSEPSARMALARLDPTKFPNTDNVEGVYGKYMYIGASGKISFAEVSGTEGTVYGSADARSQNGVEAGFSVDDNIIHGTLVKDGAQINVAEEGLYYVIADINASIFLIVPVKGQVIGDALVDLAWSAGTVLPLKSVSPTETIFEATNVKMTFGNGYKFRFHNGWHAYTNEELSTFSFLGELSYGDAWAAQAINPGFFTENIPSFARGLYTINLKFTANPLGEGVWAATVTKTGELLQDYSTFSMAIIGDATENGNWNGDGTGGYGAATPVKSGNIYTWTWNDVSFLEGKEFIFLQGATWGGLQIDYTGASVGGNAITNGKIIDATAEPVGSEYHNFHVVTGGTYDVTLVIDASNESRTITITEN